MGAALRIGLICAAVALLVAALPLPLLLGYLPPPWLVPLVRPLLIGVPSALIFGPLALLLGGVAGFVAGRQAQREAVPPGDARASAVRRGLVAGAVTGCGVLGGVVVFFGVVLASLAATPELRAQMAQLFAQQFQDKGGDAGLALRVFDATFILAGLCAGILNVALALAAGAIGGWAATLARQGDKETRRQGDKETRRQGDKETRRQGESSGLGSRVSLATDVLKTKDRTMTNPALRVLVIGAHPDDCDIKAGGVAALYTRAGHTVKFVSVTNGDAGHHLVGGGALARRRKAEAQASAAVLGIAYDVLDNHDGQLLPSLENRNQIIALIRTFGPDLIMSPRPNDYHPDHRYTAQLIQDAAYMVTVPNVAAFAPHLRVDPVIVYVSDGFQKPYPFTPDVAVAIDDVVDQKVAMLHAHESQFYEWLPYNGRYDHEVPEGDAQRKAWLRGRYEAAMRAEADKNRDLLTRLYGPERGAAVRYAESFEGCEYGARLTDQNRDRLFPFFKA